MMLFSLEGFDLGGEALMEDLLLGRELFLLCGGGHITEFPLLLERLAMVFNSVNDPPRENILHHRTYTLCGAVCYFSVLQWRLRWKKLEHILFGFTFLEIRYFPFMRRLFCLGKSVCRRGGESAAGFGLVG